MRAYLGKPPEEITGRCEVEIVMHRGKLQDPDNAYGSVKGLVDSIVRAGWLKDDDPEHLKLTVREVKAKRNDYKTEIYWKRTE